MGAIRLGAFQAGGGALNQTKPKKMSNNEIKLLLSRHEELCMILKYRALSEQEEEALLEIEAKLDALP